MMPGGKERDNLSLIRRHVRTLIFVLTFLFIVSMSFFFWQWSHLRQMETTGAEFHLPAISHLDHAREQLAEIREHFLLEALGNLAPEGPSLENKFLALENELVELAELHRQFSEPGFDDLLERTDRLLLFLRSSLVEGLQPNGAESPAVEDELEALTVTVEELDRLHLSAYRTKIQSVVGRRTRDLQFFLPVVIFVSLIGAAGAGQILKLIARAARAQKDIEAALRKSESQLAEAQGLAHLGSWSRAFHSGRQDWSDELCRIFGLTPETAPRTYEGFLSLVHKEDREKVAGKTRAFKEDLQRIECEYRIVLPDGSVRHVQDQGYVVRDESGEPVQVYGAVLDITDRKLAVAELRRSESLLAEAEALAHLGSWNWDVRANRVYWSDEFYRIFGRTRGTMTPTYEGFFECVLEEDQPGVAESVRASLEEGEPHDMPYRIVWPDGSIRFIHAQGKVIFDEAKNPIRMFGTVLDITERKQVEDALRKSEAGLAEAQRIAGLGSFDWDILSGHAHVSDQTVRAYGVKDKGDLVSYDQWAALLHPDDREKVNKALQDALDGIAPYDVEFRIHRKSDGALRTITSQGEVQRDADGKPIRMVGTNFDITERREAERKIEESLREKEALLKEIHHRVKNNLQVITSLLTLQSRRTSDDQALGVLNESQARVRSIALVHEMLYQSADLASINFADYCRSLAVGLFRTYAASPDKIALEVRGREHPVAIDAAIPCGLIVSELLSNALKYAFPDGRRGKIEVSLDVCGESEYVLTVADDGIGLPEGFDVEKSESLGLKLVHTLAGQIGGAVQLSSSKGTAIEIRFPVSDARRRVSDAVAAHNDR